MKWISKCLMLVCLLVASTTARGQDDMSESLFEPLDMSFVFDRTYTTSIPTLYEMPATIYVPVSTLFDFLKIANKVTNEGKTINGFFETETNSFSIDFSQKMARYKGKEFPIEENEATMDLGMLYLKTGFFKRVFGFDMVFNERALTIQFTSPFELPLFKLMKLEKQRSMLQAQGSSDAVYDTTLNRKYHWFNGHMVDWSVSSMQSTSGTIDSRMSLGYGSELLGGETNIFLNYSTSSAFTRNQQQYTWRWADNHSPIVRQVMLGRTPTRAISSLLSPVDGIMVTNALTTIRKTLGTYRIEDYTEPDWVVELYLNNEMIAYTRSDASGFFSFKIPIVYGTIRVTLRFYGPNGEIRTEDRMYSMPFNLLPKGEFEYQLNAGTLLDSTNGTFARGQLNYGLTQKLTMSAGYEYLSTIPTNSAFPFLNLTFQPFSRLLLTGEYAHGVRSKFNMNLSLKGNVVLNGSYAKYVPGQEAIIYNYLEERAAGISVPFRVRNWSSSVRSSFRQNVYPDFTFTSGEVSWTNNYKNYNLIYSNYLNSSTSNAFNLYGTMTFGTKWKNTNFRAAAQYNYIFQQMITLRAEIDRKLFKNGYGSLKVENNFLTNSKSINFTFRYEFPYMMTNASASYSNNTLQLSESASGSFAFKSGKKYVHVSNRNAVGRSGLSIVPYIDSNFNGLHDAGEPLTKGLRVRSSGGQVLETSNDSIIRILGMEPFVDYSVILDESGFDNVSLRSSRKNMQFTTDPNQFKMYKLAVLPMAEIYGTVLDENGKGLGRIIVRVSDTQGQEITKLMTESDGYFSYIGFKPGDYKVAVDSLQLDILKYEATPVFVSVLENPEGDVVDAGEIQLVKMRELQVRKELTGLADEAESVVDTVVTVAPVVPQEVLQKDTLDLFTIYFDVNKTDVKPDYFELLKRLAEYLNRPEHELLAIDIQGHTDIDASYQYNLILSNKRSEAVKQLLISYGVRPERLKISAFGVERQAGQGSTAADKAKSRRVVFRQITIDQEAERPIDKVLGVEKVMKRVENSPSWCLMYEAGGYYMFQVAAFNDNDKAMRLAETLLSFRPEKIIVVNQGIYVKVQLGFYTNAEDAMSDANALRVMGLFK